MKKIILLLMLAIFFSAGCGNDCSDGKCKFIIGIDDEFAPMSFHNEQNELVGFDIDLAGEVAERMGAEFEFKPIDWDDKEAEITSGRVDMIWNGLDITPERKEYMIFSKPYMDDRQILLVRKDSDLEIHSENDLEGKVVCTQAGSTSYDYINNDETLKNSFKGYKVYGKFGIMLDALNSGEVDVIVCDELIARYEMNRNPDRFEIIDVKIGLITETGIGFAKKNIELRDKVQAAFDKVIADGTARKISVKWFQADLIK